MVHGNTPLELHHISAVSSCYYHYLATLLIYTVTHRSLITDIRACHSFHKSLLCVAKVCSMEVFIHGSGVMGESPRNSVILANAVKNYRSASPLTCKVYWC